MKQDESGASELMDETLIIALGLVLAVVTMVLVFGALPLTEKTAYLVPQFSTVNVSGKTVIGIFHRGGDPVTFNRSSTEKYQAQVIVDTASGSYKAVADPALADFRPGEWIVVYSTGSGFAVARNLSGATFSTLPPGKITVSFIDATSGVLIAKGDLGTGSVTTTATPTPTATLTTLTTTPTGTTTATTSPTPTSTATTSATTTATSTTTTSTTTTTTTATTTTRVTTTATTSPVTVPTTCTPGHYRNGMCPCDAYARSMGYC